MNCWRFDSRIFSACRAVAPSPRGELELPDAVQYSMESLGCRYAVRVTAETVFDLSTRADVARVARQLQNIPVRL
jgi:glucose-1-phosphate thymidylyltransferase